MNGTAKIPLLTNKLKLNTKIFLLYCTRVKTIAVSQTEDFVKFLCLGFEGVSACQQSKLSCTDEGDFLSAQKHFMSGKWLCITSQGEGLSWTSADEAITAEQCKGV